MKKNWQKTASINNLKKRDAKNYDFNVVKQQQEEEKKYAREISKLLNISCKIVNSYNKDNIKKALLMALI